MMKKIGILIGAILIVLMIFIIGKDLAREDQTESEQTVDKTKTEKVAKENKTDETADGQADTKESASPSSPLPEKMNDKQIDNLIKKMSLEEKIGQMMVVGFQSTDVDSHIKKMIETYHVGGIILYDRNMTNPKQVKTLNQDLQTLARDSSNGIPLIISVDQEGGDIVRMPDHVSNIPSQKELGKKGNEDEVYSVAKQNAKELSSMGFNVNYAPVLDLSSTDSRSFGEDPEQAYQFGKQVITGFADSSVVGALKHFPGHGRSDVDPHFDSSSVDAEKGDLENTDIYPFKKMIEEVDQSNYFVMVTHFIYPAYDKKLPASVSPTIIRDLLREELGFDGIVVTDDLEMGAVAKLYSYEELGYKAVNAGADLLLVCHTLESQEKVYNGILQAVQNGKLTEEQIDQSVKRILKHKFGS
ncbi:glycoside hydrolase family 3 protein [Oceanobacillus sp. Castelsardo]|uniref:glycoside hydrolase family 3 protein n=1 Tax=Oceanobacillus sp. Castelsardo TaxID=1851204 RepID=UPI000ACE7628|nr:glycoside hydrolase family 3 N-terminal domain-containing protein [Oceanobacillus sp. Castelsardo]